jgi:hypothetical protein
VKFSLLIIIIFFFLTCPHKGRGGGIRSCDLRFIKRGSQLIELPLGDSFPYLLSSRLTQLLFSFYPWDIFIFTCFVDLAGSCREGRLESFVRFEDEQGILLEMIKFISD